MQIMLIFIGSLALSVLAFDVISGIHEASFYGRTRLSGGLSSSSNVPILQRRSIWEALLINLFPGRFDPSDARSADVISMLRRAGYPYDTPGDFYAAAVRDFTMFLIVGGLLAGALTAFDMAIAAPVIAGVFIFLGLRRPYTRLKNLAKKRAESMRNNMLIGMSELDALLSAGVGTQEALRRTSSVGGPFCNLLALLVARMEVEPIEKAIQTVSNHLPDPRDIEANLFLRDIRDFFENNRPIATSVSALRESLHRSVVETTEARAALVRQRSGLFGGMAVIGLILSIIGPYLGAMGF